MGFGSKVVFDAQAFGTEYHYPQVSSSALIGAILTNIT